MNPTKNVVELQWKGYQFCSPCCPLRFTFVTPFSCIYIIGDDLFYIYIIGDTLFYVYIIGDALFNIYIIGDSYSIFTL